MHDTMRGWGTSGLVNNVYANFSVAESNIANSSVMLSPTATGFSSTGNWFGANSEYIYMAIRRGPMAVPESATDVFDVVSQTPVSNLSGTEINSSTGVVDFVSTKVINGSGIIDWGQWDRFRGGARLRTNSTAVENDFGTTYNMFFDYSDGFLDNFYYPQGTITSTVIYHMWKRAPSFFDVVAYSGNSTAGRTVSHNLGVAPEMMWVKSRTDSTFWPVYHKDVGYSSVLRLDSSSTPITIGMVTNTSDTDFTLSTSAAVNSSGHNFIAYLFATLPGISKVGSYTGTGATLNIGCGFTSGARFVLIKRTDAAGQWLTFDSERGIAAGNDPVLFLNSDSAEDSGYDIIDPYSSGFTVTADATYEQNISGGSYIFYAIA